MAITNLANGTGRRKTSVARVYLRAGKGNIKVNGHDLETYFPLDYQRNILLQPLVVTDSKEKYDILINVKGGGTTGQVGACIHGIARALVDVDENNRPSLKSNGFLTRDARMVERKKYGKRGARRSFQFSKR